MEYPCTYLLDGYWVRIHVADQQQLERAVGYDHNFVVRDPAGTLREAASAEEPTSSRTWTVRTDQPGVQFYSGNFLAYTARGYTGTTYDQRAGFCLEAQHFPRSPHRPSFPSPVLQPRMHFHSVAELTLGDKFMGREERYEGAVPSGHADL